MCYGEFISSFAACLGKIGHTMRGDSSRTRAGEQRNLIGQMGLIEIAEFRRHSCGAVRRRSFHVLQQGLEPHNPRQALWRKTYPMAQEAIQMAKTNLTVVGELPYSYLPAAFFNSFECHLNTQVNLDVGQSLNEQFFQDVDPLINRPRSGQAFLQTRTIFGQQCRQSYTVLDKSVDW
jgi:hypothetical protein